MFKYFAIFIIGAVSAATNLNKLEYAIVNLQDTTTNTTIDSNTATDSNTTDCNTTDPDANCTKPEPEPPLPSGGSTLDPNIYGGYGHMVFVTKE